MFRVGLGSKEVASFPNCGLMNQHLEQLEIQVQLFPQQLCPKLAFYSWLWAPWNALELASRESWCLLQKYQLKWKKFTGLSNHLITLSPALPPAPLLPEAWFGLR